VAKALINHINIYNPILLKTIMPDISLVIKNKEAILTTIKLRGPSLPVQIGKAISIEPMLAAALLSELKAEQKIKISNMKVGSSPLYFIPGQENQLEASVDHLNSKEREAFNLLKQSKILEDEKLQPPIRVALRSIKDFASPLRVRNKEELKLFWKFANLSDKEVTPLIQKIIHSEKSIARNVREESQKTIKPKINSTNNSNLENSTQKSVTPQFSKQNTPLTTNENDALLSTTYSETIPINNNNIDKTTSTNNKIPANTKSFTKTIQQTIPKHQSPKPPKIPKPKPIHEFPQKIKSYLQAKDIEIIETTSEKKREFCAKVRIDSLFGKQSYLLIAKEKKKITENDLSLAHQKAQLEKMPSLIISPGELTKNAKIHIKDWQNLIKFERLK
jgi:hypothetical protein